MSARPVDDLIGQTLGGRYAVVGVLGEGTLGAVYQAKHTGTGRNLALKVLRVGRVASRKLLSRLETEARAAGSIESEHVVKVFDAGVDEITGSSFLAMELLRGETLAALLDRAGKLPPDIACRIAIEACRGLEKAHAVGVLHRDIKPANLFLAERDGGEVRIKIVDFGLAKMLEPELGSASSRAQLTATGLLVGSPHYLAPEQARGLPDIDGRADVFSIGMVLYEMLAGRPAFADLRTLPALLDAITSRAAPPLSGVVPEIDARLEAAVASAIATARDARCRDVATFREAIAACAPPRSALSSAELSALVRSGAPTERDATPLTKPSATPTAALLTEADRPTLRLEPPVAPPRARSDHPTLQSATGPEGAGEREPGPPPRPASSAPPAPPTAVSPLPTEPTWVSGAPAPPAPAQAPPHPRRSRPRRDPTLYVVLIALLIAVLLATAAFVISRRGTKASDPREKPASARPR